MKALTLWQPWASGVAIGAKRIETRSWPTTYRGHLAIHAAKARTQALADAFDGYRSTFRAAGIKAFEELPFGSVILICQLVDCIPVERLGSVPQLERRFGNFDSGRFAWLLGDVRVLATPIPARGAQGLW